MTSLSTDVSSADNAETGRQYMETIQVLEGASAPPERASQESGLEPDIILRQQTPQGLVEAWIIWTGDNEGPYTIACRLADSPLSRTFKISPTRFRTYEAARHRLFSIWETDRPENES